MLLDSPNSYPAIRRTASGKISLRLPNDSAFCQSGAMAIERQS
jgi:hypothetical protein